MMLIYRFTYICHWLQTVTETNINIIGGQKKWICVMTGH